MKALRLAVFPLAVLLACATALAEPNRFEVLDESMVYYGDSSSFEKPASVVSRSVFARIDEYRLIKEKGLGEDDPEYWVLLLRASNAFRDAAKSAAVLLGYDLIAESGAVSSGEEGDVVPDITGFVISQID